MNFSFREATAADLEALCRIEGTGWTRGQFESELGKGLFVVDSLAGFAALRIVGDQSEIYMIGVSADQRRGGIARGLMEECFRRAKAGGCGIMKLEVSADNVPAISLYEAFGFHVVGRRSKYYNDGTDALLMDASL